MRIIGKTHDYYDGAGMYSDEPVWYRKEEEIVLSKTVPTDKLSFQQVNFLNELYETMPFIGDDRCENYLLGLCGKIFPVFILMTGEYTEGRWNGGWNPGIYQYRHSAHDSVESFEEKCLKVIPKKENDQRLAKIGDDLNHKKKYGYGFSRTKYYAHRKGALEAFQQKMVQSTVDQIFIDLGTPLFMIDSKVVGRRRETILVTNPTLTDFKMQKMIDPWTLYQKLEMYLANELVMCKVPPFNTTDELKRDAHGFDTKSFKNVKGHKRGKR